VIRPPFWLEGTRLRRMWWWCGAAESLIGLWLRHFSQDVRPVWLWVLALLLGLRLAASAWRDLSGEALALRSRCTLHGRSWRDGMPARQEHLQTIESGTRAALQLRTGVATLALLLPTMALLAPPLAIGAALCALLMGLASRGRSQALRPLSQRSLAVQEAFEAEELWARRALPEASAGGMGQAVARTRIRGGLRLLGEHLEHARRWQFFQSAMEVAAHAASIGLCVLAFLHWRGGHLPIGQFLSFLALALLAYRPVREAGRALPACARAASLRLPEPERLAPARGQRLVLCALDFGYSAPLFRDLDLSLEPGSVSLLHGPNGSGKTTLLRLCAGSLEPHSGSVQLPEGRLHWVDQETVLPPLSPRRWTGLPTPPESPEVQAFFRSHVEPFLPGLDWNGAIPEGGTHLSRGQRARLRLWMLACDPGALWLLDEPLSAIPRPERLGLLRDLLACRGKATVLIVDQEIPDLPSRPIPLEGSALSLVRLEESPPIRP
jgi:ABC-type transport system involved in cytochrome c biogenesis ATPase subunit